MGQFLTYKCDRCGKEWLSTDKTEQPVSIGICVSFGKPSNYDIRWEDMKTSLWCRTCVMSVGVNEPATEKDKKVAPPVALTLEEKILSLLKELGLVQRIEEVEE